MPLPIVDNCDGCGACCMQMRTPPFDRGGDPDWDVLPEALKAEVRRSAATPFSQRANFSPCIWLDLESRDCRHYEHRPEVCRSFEIGTKWCLGHREREGVR